MVENEGNLPDTINQTSAVSSPKRLVDYDSDISSAEETNEVQGKNHQHQKEAIELRHLQACKVCYFDFTLQGVPG